MAQGQPSTASTQFGQRARPARLCNLDRLFNAMEARGLDGLLSYYSRNVMYLGGYASGSTAIYGEANGVAAFVISRHEPDHPIAIMPEFEIGYFLRQPTWVQDIRLYRTLILPFDIPTEPSAVDRFIPEGAHDVPWVQHARESFAESLTRACVQALKDVGLHRGRVAFDNLSFAPFVASDLPHLQVVDGYGLLKFVRMVKTDAELSLLREAHRLNQTAIEHTANAWVPGMSWNELSMSYYLEAVRLGGFILDRGSMLFFNPRGSESTVRFSTGLEEDFPLEPGMHIMFDCHGRLNNYNWDGGKTWIVSDDPSGLEKTIVRACGDAMGETLNAARPGMKLSQLQSQARRVFERHRVPASDLVLTYFHGVGLDNSEQEWGTPADWAMENGMVVAAHFLYPGDAKQRYFVEEIGVVKPDGMERFFTWDYHKPV